MADIKSSSDIDIITSKVTEALLSSGRSNVPHSMFRKHIRSNWNTDLKDSHAFSKECYRIWVAAGKPLDPNHPLKCAYKEAKQAFLRHFRALRMSETENFYLSVDISNPAIFRLIRSKLAQQKTSSY